MLYQSNSPSPNIEIWKHSASILVFLQIGNVLRPVLLGLPATHHLISGLRLMIFGLLSWKFLCMLSRNEDLPQCVMDSAERVLWASCASRGARAGTPCYKPQQQCSSEASLACCRKVCLVHMGALRTLCGTLRQSGCGWLMANCPEQTHTVCWNGPCLFCAGPRGSCSATHNSNASQQA